MPAADGRPNLLAGCCPDDRRAPPSVTASTPRPREALYDPLRLCIFATVALLGWLLGPFALLLFAGLGFAGYVRPAAPG